MTIDKQIQQILVPMGPSKRVDKYRIEKAYQKSSSDTRFLISGGDELRVYLMPEQLIDKGVDEKNILINKDNGSYAHIFMDFIEKINEFPLTGISTNSVGFKRFQLYIAAAKREGLIDRDKRIIGLNSLEYVLNPFGFLVETRGLKKDMKYFANGFSKGIEEKYSGSRKKLFGIDGRIIGK